ncbi:MAG: hypothetical protein RID11_03265 [Roseovarius sp.]|uniref:hypothetical protein n=1 Tax=Roseovarius sp. TaxID=1486281 RepID=UPI0032EA92F6
MFRKSLRLAAVVAGPVIGLWAGPALAQPVNLNQFCLKGGHGAGEQQPWVPFETRTTSPDGSTTFLTTAGGEALLPEGDPFSPNPPNMLPTIYENAKTCRGNDIPHTLPSTPENPYNLHDTPVTRTIDKTSPTDDLDWIMDRIEAISEPYKICRSFRGYEFCYEYPRRVNPGDLRRLAGHAVDIIEGNDLRGRFRDREYEGFPLLHYLGGLKTKSVDPETKSVTMTQIWYDTHIEGDTAYVDPTVVNDEEWTIKYIIKILNRGHEDFAPYTMFFDDPRELNFTEEGGPDLTQGGTVLPRLPNIGMDQTFFPMEEGLEYTLNMKMPPARFWNLSYHWGWRNHPPRVQVTENVLVPLANGMPRNAAEIAVFGENPRASEEAKLNAIGMIGDTAPAKRMWRMFREMADLNTGRGYRRHFFGLNGSTIQAQMELVRQAFYDWQNRKLLPTGYEMAEDADMTVLFLNNTMYGQLKGHDGDAEVRMKDTVWDNRGDVVNVQLLNGDYYPHAYVLVDFGGLRGWENTFHNTLPVGGAGPLFTFGRNYFWIHVAGQGPIPVPPATRPEEASPTPVSQLGWNPGRYAGLGHRFAWGGMQQEMSDYVNTDGVGEHNVEVTFTYEPSRRLRMYQFDALHHDVAVWSVH